MKARPQGCEVRAIPRRPSPAGPGTAERARSENVQSSKFHRVYFIVYTRLSFGVVERSKIESFLAQMQFGWLGPSDSTI